MRQLLRHQQRRLHLSKNLFASNTRCRFLLLMRANLFLSLLAAAAALALGNVLLAESVPDTPKKPVATEFHGVTVEDPYQWLEEDDDSQVKAWEDAQNQQKRKNLDNFPERGAV